MIPLINQLLAILKDGFYRAIASHLTFGACVVRVLVNCGASKLCRQFEQLQSKFLIHEGSPIVKSECAYEARTHFNTGCNPHLLGNAV